MRSTTLLSVQDVIRRFSMAFTIHHCVARILSSVEGSLNYSKVRVSEKASSPVDRGQNGPTELLRVVAQHSAAVRTHSRSQAAATGHNKYKDPDAAPSPPSGLGRRRAEDRDHG
jgi:hypothetical protein